MAIEQAVADTFSFDFSDRTVLVTGGTRGVGARIAEYFLQAGAQVLVCGRNKPQELPEAAGNKAVFVAADIREYDQAQYFVGAGQERFGSVDVLINNAGGSPMAAAADASPRFSEAIIRLNLLAPLFCSQAANAIMQEQQQGGSIINIASVSAVRPSPLTAAYGAAKGGLVNLTRSLAIEWAPKVRINTIIAGLLKTEQSELHYGNAEGLEAVARTLPMGRLGLPEDIANCCLFLASPMASWATGGAFPIDGGGEVPLFLQASNAAKPDDA